MANDVNITLRVNAQTGQLEVVSKGLQEIEKHAEKGGEAFDKLGRKMTNIAVTAFFVNAVRGALQAQESFQQLKATFDETARSLFSVVAPAFDYITKGLRGLLTTVQGSVKAFQTLMKGDIETFMTQLGDAILAGGEVIRTNAKLTTDQMRDANLRNLKLQLEDVRQHSEMTVAQEFMSADERMTLERDTLAEQKIILDEAYANHLITQEQFNNEAFRIAQESARRVTALTVDEFNKRKMAEISQANSILQVERSVANTLIGLAYEAGEKRKLSGKQFAAEVVKTAGQAAAQVIMANYAAGASQAVMMKGMAGLPEAALLLAQGAALSAAVSAATGAAVGGIMGGGGAGGGGGAEAGGVEIGGGGGAAIGGTPMGPSAQPGMSTVVNITVPEGTDVDQARRISRAVNEELMLMQRG